MAIGYPIMQWEKQAAVLTHFDLCSLCLEGRKHMWCVPVNKEENVHRQSTYLGLYVITVHVIIFLSYGRCIY